VEKRAPISGATLLVGLPGPDLDPETERRLALLAPAGVVLFRRNLVAPEQTLALLDRVRALLGPTAIGAVDQEGGRVSRLMPWIGPTPTACALGRAGPDVAARFGAATGALLRAAGFDLDFAPVVDLCAPEAANGIGDRSYSADPVVTAAAAGAFLDGLQATGIAGCLKHFPGLGSTRLDSHLTLPTAEHDLARLDSRDLVPFRELAPRAACVMVGHATYPALDPSGDPASLSRPIIQGWLRERVGFQGLVVSDDLEMGAVAPLDGDGAAAVRAVAAGCDMILYCADLAAAERAAGALAARAARDPAFARRLEQAAERVRRFSRRLRSRPAVAPDWNAALAVLRQAVPDGLA